MNKALFLSAASCLALLASPAFAQDQEEQDEALASGDIIVTANRTESLL